MPRVILPDALAQEAPTFLVTLPEAIVERIDDYLRRLLTVQVDTNRMAASFDDGCVRVGYTVRPSEHGGNWRCFALRVQLLSSPRDLTIEQIAEGVKGESQRLLQHVREAFHPDEDTLISHVTTFTVGITWIGEVSL